MIRGDWSGLLDAPRWWHLEGGLVVFGYLRHWTSRHVWVDVPEGGLMAKWRISGITRLTIEGDLAWQKISQPD